MGAVGTSGTTRGAIRLRAFCCALIASALGFALNSALDAVKLRPDNVGIFASPGHSRALYANRGGPRAEHADSKFPVCRPASWLLPIRSRAMWEAGTVSSNGAGRERSIRCRSTVGAHRPWHPPQFGSYPFN